MSSNLKVVFLLLLVILPFAFAMEHSKNSDGGKKESIEEPCKSVEKSKKEKVKT